MVSASRPDSCPCSCCSLQGNPSTLMARHGIWLHALVSLLVAFLSKVSSSDIGSSACRQPTTSCQRAPPRAREHLHPEIVPLFLIACRATPLICCHSGSEWW